MQIREHGQKVVIIKTEYDPAIKRTRGRTVASQDIYMSTVSDDVRRRLSEEEVDQLERWLSIRSKKMNVDMLASYLSTAAHSIGRVAEALYVDSLRDGLSPAAAAEIYDAIDGLTKAMRKAGHRRPPRVKATQS